MERNLFGWHSPSLNKEMPIVTYGYYGFALLLVPTAAADYLEYERFQLIDSLRPFIDGGKLKVYSINSINNESWLNNEIDGAQKAIRHQQFNDYVINEVVPYIRNTSSQETPIYVCGASFGALHSANLFFHRPDLINGCIAMSGVYNLMEYTKGYYDENVYFNSPMHYMPNLTDHNVLEQIRRSSHIHIFSGSGPYEDPNSSKEFASILYNKGIWYELDIWGQEWAHDWPTWRAVLPHYLSTRF
ncbi:MAG TPA: alpha/beta hydrolase-fold protein [Chitinophagaceae bacterium]|nr:alpha/beta hydrolase-fold protein [Chitinophagaceae bacterium]